MTIDTTLPPAPPRPARPTRSRKAPARWGRRRRLAIPRRRATGRFKLPDASTALNTLMLEGDVYKIGRTHYLVVPLRADMLDMLILAAGATEDDEPSLGAGQIWDDATLVADGESDGDCDAEEDDPPGGNIDDEPHDEPYQDMEPDSEAEEDDHGGCNPHISPADIDAQRGRIASRWPAPETGGDRWVKRIPGLSWNTLPFDPRSRRPGDAK